MLPVKCSRCEGQLIKAVNENTIMAKTVYDPGFTQNCLTQKMICVQCGIIEEYALKPQRFTDSKLKHESAK